MGFFAKRAKTDLKVLAEIKGHVDAMTDQVHAAERDEAELTAQAKAAVAAVARLEEPPHAMLLTPLLEYGLILAERGDVGSPEGHERLNDLTCITLVQIAGFAAELQGVIDKEVAATLDAFATEGEARSTLH